ncbi:VanZ family protein [Fusibacter sp. JL216-2]|uniref:VanZ family protein n=1 Tax=Fusibacter sp. JL216-2 TaxID=3071453 RepID=UPI003D32A712
MNNKENKTHKNRLKIWLPVLIWMFVIFMFSAQPASQSGEMSGTITKWVMSVINMTPLSGIITKSLLHTLIRKCAHLTIYFVLACLVSRALFMEGVKASKNIVLTITLCMLYAMSDEFHQAFVPGRGAGVKDVVIDTIGASLGTFISHSLKKRSK